MQNKDYPCLHDLFEAQARRTPEAPAVSEARTELTYEELDQHTDALAARLREAGVGRDTVVGVYMERRAEYVVAMLAALKAGGAFLPLEPAYPPAMLDEVLADAEPRVVLTAQSHAERLPKPQARICLDELPGADAAPAAPLGDRDRPDADNLAFVSYSSGTTGKPKGIANPHRAAVRSYLWRFGISDYGPGDRVGCNVFFVWEALRPLLRGGTTVVIPDDEIYDPAALVRFLEEHEVTETLVTPSLLETVLNSEPDLEERLGGLRTLWLNGEVVTRTLAWRAMEALPHTRLLNVYSASETHEVAAGDLRELVGSSAATYCPVGPPMDPEHTYILDEDQRPVPNGEAGELYVGGDGLARGYVNRPETTARRFPEDPFASGARMYRTGDKARLLPDGNLEILGRCDFMVKMRGYSVELGAVEAAIEDTLAVRNCVVVAEGAEGADKRLVAYLTPASDPAEHGDRLTGWSLDPATGRSPDIRRALQAGLPHYATPAVFVELETLPLQETTGKVDRARLPEPPARSSAGTSEPVGPVPANATREEKEAALVGLWEEVLRLEEGDISTGDDFFDAGGHSLAAAELLGRVEDVFGVRLPMESLLDEPTPAGIRTALEAHQNGMPAPANKGRPEPDPRADAVLEPEISPEKANGHPTTSGEARRIFLTGATGFLGAFLLDGLLSDTNAEVYCLVRSQEDPLDAIRSNLEHYGLSSADERRIVPVTGDLEEPLLGIDEEEFDRLAQELDVVVHAGARVNLLYPYAALRAANVEGTREVLRLAGRHRTKPVHHVSTNGIFPPGAGLCREDADLEALAEARDDGYGRSKWAAERLVWQAVDRGLPVSVYRPGNVSGHSESGASNPRDLLGALLAESLRVGCAPQVEGWRLEMTPVDFVAGTILKVADEPAAFGRAYHLANPAPPLAEDVFDRLGEEGYPLGRLPYPEWLEARNAAPGGGNIGAVFDGAPPDAHEIWDHNTYDDANLRRFLGRSGPERPAVDARLLGAYARYFEEQGWTGSPRREPARRG